MKSASAKIVATSSLLLLVGVWCSTAAAETIQITSGSLQMSGVSAGQAGTVSLVGDTRGFTLSARVNTFEGIFRPWEQCQYNPVCVPGAPIDLRAYWIGLGLVSTVTLDGQTFTRVGSLSSDDAAAIEFIGSAMAPAFGTGTASLSAPFQFDGQFARALGGGVRFVGQGIATLSLTQSFGPNESLTPAWRVVGARYEFTPTPEPATLVLTGAGLVGVMSRQRWRGRASR